MLGVVVYHYTPERFSTGPLMGNGFLVMSGFLVGASVFSAKGLNVHHFFNSKCRRLLPMFLLALLFGIVAHVLNGANLPTWPAPKWGSFDIVTFISFYNVPLWYMVVEFTMLLLVPFFVFLASARWRLEICTLLLMLTSLLLFSRVPENAPFGEGLYYSPIARCWQFMLGLSSAKILSSINIVKLTLNPTLRFTKWILFSIFCIVSILLMFTKQAKDLNYWNYTFSFDFITTVYFAILVPLLYITKNKTTIITPLITKLSILTYPIYLIHKIVEGCCDFIANKLTDAPPYIIIALSAAILSITGAFVLLYIDNKLQQYLKPRQSKNSNI